MTDTNGNMVMPVAPFYNNGYGGGNDMFGGNWMWFLLIWMAMFGWGNGGYGFGGGQGGGRVGCEVQNGFDHQAVMSGITGVQNAVNGIVPALQNGFAQAEIAANSRQMADMNQVFALQTAMLGGFNTNSAAAADLKYTVATEACADRNAIASGIRDVMENCNRNNQAVIDKLCALELDGVKNQLAAAQRENVGLQNQLNMANLAASQNAQTTQIRDSIISELRSCPIPAQPVYGSQPIFTCGQGYNPGCGCNGYAA